MASTGAGDTLPDAPTGVVCDPVTGVCRMPAGDEDVFAGGLVPLPKNLRPFNVLEDENGNRVQPDVLKGKFMVRPNPRPYQLGQPSDTQFTGQAYLKNERELGREKGISMVGVYFSASWCPPCRQFSPMLSKWAKERSKDVVIVFVSFDKSEQDMSEFTAGKGFLRMPFTPGSAREKAAQEYQVQVIPTLVIVNGDTGAVVTTWGRSAVTKNPAGCVEEWRAGRSGVTWVQFLKPW